MSDTPPIPLDRIRTEADRVAVVDRARALLAQARTPAQAKNVADLAKAAETYARLQQLGEEAVTHARAICVDALALMGEMLKQVQKATGSQGTGSNQHQTKEVRLPEGTAPTPTLADQNISKKQSMAAQALATVKETTPDLYARIKAGKASIATAHVEVKRQEKRDAMTARAAAAPGEESPAWELLRGEVGTASDPLLRATGEARLVFADPPYNIGFDYGEGHDDARPRDQYLAWCRTWIGRCRARLAPNGAMWVLINDEHAAEYKLLLDGTGLALRNWVIWYETFGVNCAAKFNRTKRHLLYYVADPARFVFHFDAVSRPSDRLERGDARASASGKVLDDVWFDIPRLVGTAAERTPDFPTQLPVALLKRIVGCCTDPGDLVLDPFSGSGTTGVAAVELGRRYLGVERSARNVELSTLRLKGIRRETV